MSNSDFPVQSNSKKELVKKLVLIGAAAVFIAACLLVYFFAIAPKPTKGEKQVKLEFEYSNVTYKYDVNTDTDFVFDMLKEVNDALDLNMQTETGEWGEFITSFKNIKQAGGYYYIIYVDGESSMTGVSTLPVEDGKTYTFKYENQTWEGDQFVGSELGKGSPKVKLIVFFSVAGGVLVLGIGAYFVVTAAMKKRTRNSSDE